MAELRAKEAYPLLADLFRMPVTVVYEYFDEPVVEEASRLLASVFDGDPNLLKNQTEDTNADVLMRMEAIATLIILSKRGEVQRTDVAEIVLGQTRRHTLPGVEQ